MSLIVVIAAWMAAGQVGPAAPCPAAATQVLTAAQEALLAGEPASARELLRGGIAQSPACPLMALAARVLEGWDAAVAAAKVGGTAEALAPTRGILAALEKQAPRGATPDAYAVALLHAVAAASQDEREELKVWIEHARLMASRLALANEPAVWPLPIELAEASLWMLVDDYEQAEQGFDAAIARRESVAALAGLARARDRRGNKAGACAAFRRASALVPPQFRSGAIAIEARGYTLLCDP